jgi:hypothetical protein
MSQDQPRPSIFSLAARIVPAMAIGVSLALLDSTSPRMTIFGLRISGITTVALVMIVLLILSILFERAFWLGQGIRMRRIIGGATLAVLVIALSLLPTNYSMVLVLLPTPMVAAFILYYPGEPTYNTTHVASWCGMSSLTGLVAAELYFILSTPPPRCPPTARCWFVIDFRMFNSVALLLVWLFGLLIAQLLALSGISLRFMKPVGRIAMPSAQYNRHKVD